VLVAESEVGYRQRMRFSMSGRGPTLKYAMFEGSKAAAQCEGLALASARINALMPLVLEVLRCDDVDLGGHDLRAVHVHAPTLKSGEPVVTLVYGESLGDRDQWLLAAGRARRQLAEKEDLHFVGRCKGLTLASDKDYVLEELVFPKDRVLLEFAEGSFSHPNTRANERSVAWLRDRLRDLASGDDDDDGKKKKRVDLLELFCGAGNHTTCLASFCQTILAVEIDPALVKAAERNLARNGVSNATVLRADAQTFSNKLRRRHHKNPTLLGYDVLLVDPPRRGLDAATLDLLANFHDVLYVSCNPAALHRDLTHLTHTHTIAAFAALDAFPSTPHLECLVHLNRRRRPTNWKNE